MTFALILFVVTYAFMMCFSKYRTYIALVSALIFIILGVLPFGKAFENIDFNVILMIAGTMGLVALFKQSKMPELLADLILEKAPNVQWAMVALALFAGIISAFVDNVSTVLMIAPVALGISKKLKINPVPMIISIVVSSNLQGAATLVGDTTAIMLGSYANMSFTDFFVYKGRPSMFFAVELGAALSAMILVFMFRKHKQAIPEVKRTVVKDLVPSILLAGTVICLVIASFIKDRPTVTNGIICCTFLIIGLIYTAVRYKDVKLIKSALKEIDFETILLLTGLFIIIGGITNAGVIDQIAELLATTKGGMFVIYTVVVWASVLFSAFIDNIPYVATMLPVIQGLALKLGVDPTVLYFGLLSGATLGGNLTPIGASANITGIGILRKEGFDVKSLDFMKIGVPFTLAAVIPGYIYCWLMYGIY